MISHTNGCHGDIKQIIHIHFGYVLVVAIAAFRYTAMAVVKKETDGTSQAGRQVVPAVPPAQDPSPAPSNGAKKRKTQDFRLATLLEDQRFVREQLREKDRLIS